ncbi:MFS transporter [Streptacidiphilus sp. EB129]|uniref:MFS transporter n=1 Tax=Streptacidiphilus sp. EB129 TaxID=3156262 RepID=UPI003518E564
MPQINKSVVTSAPPLLTRLAAGWSPARTALTVFFALDGFLFAGWVVRIPAIKTEVHASAAQLGLALLCVSFGALAVMTGVGRLCLRYGNHPVTAGAAVLLSASAALPPQVHSVLGLGGVLLLFGAGYGAMNIGINSAAVDLVAAARRPIMPSFHAAYSLGGLIGASLGGLLAGVLSPARHLGLIAVFGLVVTVLAGVPLLRHRVAPAPRADLARAAVDDVANGTAAPAGTVPGGGGAAGAGARLGARGPLLLVLLLGVVALCDAYGEGALADWGTLHLSADLHTSAAVAAAGFATYSLAMTTGRLSGTRLVERFGPTRVMITGAGVAGAGMLVSALSPWLPLVLGGFLLVGLGLANIFPLAIDRAGALDGPKGVATASMLGYGGMVLGPPLIGFLAQGVGLPNALVSVALLAWLAGVAALAVQRAGSSAGPGLPRPGAGDRAGDGAGRTGGVRAEGRADASGGRTPCGSTADGAGAGQVS